MPPKAPILGLLFLLQAVTAGGQEAGPREVWEYALEEEPALIERVKDLEAGLEQGDVGALTRQFRPGKLRLIMLGTALPPDLYGHSQAAAILKDHLRRRPVPELRISLSRREAGGGSVQVALDALSRRGAGVRARRDRYVATYRRQDGIWDLAELRCP